MKTRMKKKGRSAGTIFFATCIPTLLALLAAACSSQRQLTPETAKKMIANALQEQAKPYTISYAGLEPLVIASTLENYAEGQYQPGSAKQKLKDLIAAGYVAQTKETKRVPIISGEYSGSYTDHNVTVKLENVPNTDTIQGSFAQVHTPSGCHASGEIAGVLDAEGSGAIQFVYKRGGGCYSSGGKGSVALTKADGATLRGSCDGYWSDNAAFGASGTLTCQVVFHAPEPPKAYSETTRFHYSFGNKFTGLVVQPQQKLISAGSITIDKVERLLLGPTDTMAMGQFVWHVDFNDAARIIDSKTATQGTGQAQFGKQPDGNWVLVNHSP